MAAYPGFGVMIRFINADDFLRHFVAQRVVSLAGQYGSGKTSLAVALSYLLQSGGIIEATVSTSPIVWSIPPWDCPSSNFCVVLDELGTEFDNRSFADRKQNKMRTALLAFPRKLNMYIIVSSFVSPDVSFRFITVQRMFDLNPMVPFEIYSYGIENGDIKSQGWFGIYDRAWLWRVDRDNPSPKYGSEAVPDSEYFAQIVALIERAIREARPSDKSPVEFFGSESEREALRQFYRMGYNPNADTILQSPQAPSRTAVSGADNSPGPSNEQVLGGFVAQTSSSGGHSFPY